MQRNGKATRINLFDITSPPMRAFHYPSEGAQGPPAQRRHIAELAEVAA